MEQLNTAVTAALADMAANGTIEKIITDKVEKTVESAINDALRSYSDFGKQVKEAVKESLKVNAEDISLPQYNQFILNVVRGKIEEQINIVGKERIEKDLEELLSGAVPETLKLSKLVEQFKEFVHNDEHGDHDDEVTVLIHRSRGLTDGYWRVYLDKEAGKEKYYCEYSLAMDKEGKVYAMSVEGKDIDKTLFIGRFNTFAKTLFQIYAAGTKIELDHEAVDMYHTDYDEY